MRKWLKENLFLVRVVAFLVFVIATLVLIGVTSEASAPVSSDPGYWYWISTSLW